MWYGEDCPPTIETRRKLEELNCTLVEGKCEYPSDPIYNKISACNIPIETEYGLWLDSDIYILGELGSLLTGDFDVSAPPTDRSIHKWASENEKEAWEKLYKLTNVSPPEFGLKTYFDSQEGLFYLCSGLIVFKSTSGFPKMYAEVCKAILEAKDRVDVQNFSQTGLTIATIKGEFKYKYVPEVMHYCYATHGHSLSSDAIVIHYQDAMISELLIKEWEI
jgi:hypothetical protein